jgi:alpha-galactosidase
MPALKSSLPLLAAFALALTTGRAPAGEGGPSPDLRAKDAPPNCLWLDSLDLGLMTQGWGSPQARKSVDGRAITLKGEIYAHGIGTHAASEWLIDLKGAARKFLADVGIDDEVNDRGSVEFEVWVDGKKAASTPVLRGGGKPARIEVDLAGAKKMLLLVTEGVDGINYDHADWAGVLLVLDPTAQSKPQAIAAPQEPPPPIASGDSPVPAIHGPRVVGSTPGRPFLFLVPVTGEGPLAFSARGLPEGLVLDPDTGIISGSLEKDGETVVDLAVKGPRGEGRRKLRIVGGKGKLALTPPMGWNSWNVWAGAVDDEKVRRAADGLVKSGLAAHGFQFINIDDTWEGKRDEKGELGTNNKFPDMLGLADYVHSKGLKLGIYSSPGPKTCAGFEGSYRHEEIDATTWARWGIDYLKHDWCSYGGVAGGNDRAALMKPYRIMRAALDKVDRDIVYSLCQYGMGNVWEWGGEVGGNLWRTTGDINDSWGSLAGIGFGQNEAAKYAAPGRWNDPDMLVVGRVGWGPSLHPSHLSGNEQITHISLWCLLAAPLLIGCDLSNMDRFTLDILTNDEVLDVDQDLLGKAAQRRSREGALEVWSRPLWDGTTAVGLFNRSREAAEAKALWKDIGVEGRQPVRDLWLRKDLEPAEGSFAARVPSHGAVLVKIGAPKGE